MAKLSILAGTTSKTVKVFVQNNSVTTGAGLTGLVFNTAGLTAYYIREGAASTTAITLATATLGTWATGGFIVVDGTNMPGLYELSIPNAALAAGAKSCTVYLQGATNMAQTLLEIELTATDNQTANTVANVVQWNSANVATPATAGIPDINVKNMNNVAATSIATINANIGVTQPINFNGTAGSAMVKADVEQINTQTVTAAAGVTFPASLASPTNITAGTITTATNLTNAPTAGDFTATMKTSLNAATPASVTGAVASVTGNVGGNVTGSVASVVAAVATTSNLKKNQALAGFMFMMTDATTHAPKTGLTVAGTVSLDGGAFGATTNSVVEVSGGWYKINLVAGDVNGNVVALRFTATGADDRDISLVTQP